MGDKLFWRRGENEFEGQMGFNAGFTPILTCQEITTLNLSKFVNRAEAWFSVSGVDVTCLTGCKA